MTSWPLASARPILVVALGLAGLALSIALAASIGEMTIPLEVIAKTVSNRLFGTTHALNRIQEGVVWDYRLSRAVVAACCGGALAVSGVILQALLRNPLAEPYVLGISAGASTGAVLVMIVGVGGGAVTLSGGAFAGAVAALSLVGLLALGSGGGSDRVLLAGVAGSQLFNAMTSFIVATAANAEQARGVLFWLLGNLGGVRWPDVWLALPVVLVGFVVAMLHARALDAFAFGADAAAAMGVSVTRVRVVLFALTAAMTAAMVGIVGSIGFVGLVIPHAVRFLVGHRHARLLPAALVVGAVFLVLADILSRVLVAQQVLPVGVVTALFGAPAFALILFRARHAR